MTTRSTELWLVAFALVAGLALRIVILTRTADLGTPIEDEQHYTQLAGNLVAGNGFAWGPDRPTSIRPPLYPAMVAGIWMIAGAGDLQAVRAVQVALAALAVALVYAIGVVAFDRRVALVAAVGLWLYPSFIFFNFTLLTETLFTVLLLAFVFFLVRLVHEPRTALALATGSALGLAALTRSALWPLPLVLCPLLVGILPVTFRKRLVLSSVVLLAYVVTIAPWAVRNSRLQHTFTVIDTMGGLNLRMGNYEHTPEDRMWAAVSLQGTQSWVYGLAADFPPGYSPTEGEKDRWAQRKAVQYMIAHPATTIRRSLIKFGDFWGLDREYLAGVRDGLYQASNVTAALISATMALACIVVVLGGIAGIWCVPPTWRTHVVLLLPVVALTGAHTLAFGHGRYHLPLVPILSLFTAAFALQIRERRPLARYSVVGATLSAIVMILIWGRQILLVDGARLRTFFDLIT